MSLPISFLSDFGSRDEFVGVVHGVIERISPGTRVIDVTHDVPRGNLRAGSLALLRAIQYLPDGVVLAVVDPGVGTGRRAIAASTARGYFVGPDNGLLAPAVAMVGGAQRFVALESPEFRLPGAGSTFDGRDLFAPAAAVLASGEAGLDDLGPEVDPSSVVPLLLPLTESAGGKVSGEVWWVDGYGNAQTNVAPEDLEGLGIHPGDDVMVRVGAVEHTMHWVTGYGTGEGPVIHCDSHGLIAIAIPGGDAAASLGIREGLSVGFRSPS
ncbi:MAG TPA: SAM-dependent chlorinase/fluorinase [Acidimicrobiia bacterium]|nr:SAM-dependent chlorinase/fluorinase [Acidimicrobiia bacterium]